MKYGHDMPLLVNMQPAGKYLGERFHRAGGVPAVLCELLRAGKLDGERADRHRQDAGREHRGRGSDRPRGHHALRQAAAGKGRLPRAHGQSLRFRDHEDQRHLRRIPQALPRAPGAKASSRAAPWCSTAPTDYHERINDPALGIDENTHPRDPRRRARSAGRARPRWSTCSRRMRCSSAASRACRRSATAGSRARPTARRSSTLAGKRRGRRPRLAAHRRHASASTSNAGPLRHAGRRTTRSRAARRMACRRCPRARRRGRSCIARRSGQLDSGAVMEMAVKYRGVATKTPRHNH